MSQISPKNCFVTGATGVVGVPLVRELVKRGHNVSVLVRGEISDGIFPATVKIFRGDLANLEVLAEAVADANRVFHLAAKLHISNPNEKLRREYYETNVEATKNLLELSVENSVEKFIYFSTINVYGTSENGKIFTEESAINPQGIYAETKAEAEKIVLGKTNPNGEKIGVSLRLAAVYGSRMKGNYVTLLDALRRNRFFFVGEGKNRRTVIHQNDAANAAIEAAENGIGGEIYNVTDGEIHTFRKIVEAMSRALGKNPPRLHLPIAPFRTVIGAVEDTAKFFGLNSTINRNLLEKLLEDIAVGGEKIRRELNFCPTYEINEGWRETVAQISKS